MSFNQYIKNNILMLPPGISVLSLKSTKDLISCLQENPHVTCLKLVWWRFSDESAEALANSPCLKNLETLIFRNNRGIKPIVGSSYLTNLKKLIIHNNAISDEDVKDIAYFPCLKNLEKFDLSRCNIGDEGVKALANSPYLKNLKELNLRGTYISDEGVKDIANSPYLKNLKELDLRDNDISDEGAKCAETIVESKCLDEDYEEKPDPSKPKIELFNKKIAELCQKETHTFVEEREEKLPADQGNPGSSKRVAFDKQASQRECSIKYTRQVKEWLQIFVMAVTLSAVIIAAAFLTQTYIILAVLIIPAMIGLYGYNECQKPNSNLQENIEVTKSTVSGIEAGA